MKTLVMAKDQYGFSEGGENLGAVASPQSKTFH